MASSARIDELRKKFDENPRRYFAPLANEYRKAGDVQRAIELCREHLPQQPGHMSGHIVYGQALFEAGEFEESRSVFEEALRLDPENLIALRHLGDIARDHGDVATARDWYQRVLDADPRNEEIAAQIASLSSAAGATAAEVAVSGSADEPAVAPDADLAADLAADIAAGVVEPPSMNAGEPLVAPRASASHSIVDHLDLSEDLATAPSERAAGSELDREETSVRPDRRGGPDRHDRRTEHESTPTPSGAAAADTAAVAEGVAAEEFSIPAGRAGAADDASFGDLDLDAGPAARGAESSSVLDEALQDAGMAPTPADGVGTAAPAPSGGADFSDFALADAPPEAPAPRVAEESDAVATAASETASAERRPDAGASSTQDAGASSGYSSGRLDGLESMEFVPPDTEPAKTNEYDDPTSGRTLREGVAPAAATPAAFVTETMAELYLQQGFRDEALAVYRQLLEQQPGDENLRDRVAQLEQGSTTSMSAATVSDAVIEAAQQRGAAHPERSVRSFFASLATRRAPVRPSSAPGDTTASGRAGDAAAGRDAESRASDAYVEAIGEGYEAPQSNGSAAAAGAQDAGARFDELGFPDVEPSSGPTDAGEAAELPESAGIEPATLDYLAHEGAESQNGGGGSADPSAAGPVDTLFDGAPVSTSDEAAAATLADAFGAPAGTTTAGRGATGGSARVPTPAAVAPAPTRDARTPATRPATRELSLDDVFRETPRRSGSVRREGSPNFSFDQFFAEGGAGAGAGGTQRSSTTPSSSASAASAGAPSPGEETAAADIEQFNAWLEGLKKK